MARPSKYEQLKEKGNLLLKVEGWARDGLTNEQIASQIGITVKTLYEWQNRYSEFCEVLKKGKEVVDRLVENALLKRALGYEFTEKKYEQAQMSDEEFYLHQQIAVNKYKIEHPESTLEELRLVELGVSRYKLVLVEEKTKDIAPDTTAQIFWLKNRKPNQWRDKREQDINFNPANMTDEEIEEQIKKLNQNE
jgi:transcriptional regulator with XRE-family HTH domain